MDAIFFSTLYQAKVVCIPIPGAVLVLSPLQYDQAIARGKLWRREQSNQAREARNANRAEQRQHWMAFDEEEPKLP